MAEIMKSDKMGKDKIPKLLFFMSIPAIISMFVQALYNIVDSFFLAEFSTLALDAVTIVFPVQILILSFALGVGVGANVLIAKYLGEKNHEKADDIARTSIILSMLCYLIFLIAGIFLTEAFVSVFTDDPATIEMGAKYLKIVMIGSIFQFMQISMEKALQATGSMKAPMVALMTGAIVNIILDPIFIFGMFGLPEMGIEGAAIATVIGQCAGFLIISYVCLFKKQDVSMSFKNFKFKRKNVAKIITSGLPVAVMNSVGSVAIILLNLILGNYAYGITILGLYFKIQSFVIMPVSGLTQGALPIMSYNFGSNNKERFYQCLKVTLITAIIVLVIGFILFQLIPTQMLTIFNIKGEMLTEGVNALKIISWSFIPAAVGIVISTAFQAIHKSFNSMMMSLMRQLILIVPIAFFLNIAIGINGVWLSYPIADCIAVATFTLIFVKDVKKTFAKRNLLQMDKSQNLTEKTIV